MLNIVATPIGNLDDLSLRQAKTLLDSDIILAEDTRSTQILFDAIKTRFTLRAPRYTKLISYYKEKEFEKLPEVIEYLKQNKNVSLISESGTPLVSDPGFLLVKTCIKENVPFTVIPGPSAVISSIVLSGFDPSQFMFLGFLPKNESEKNKILKKLMLFKESFKKLVFVFYESPHRVTETLKSINQLDWNPDIVICREITKKFEEVIRGKTSELIKKSFKGELTIILN
jgi:16S rRNA (cytidine1402-2'-O)-methyltransferase